MSPRLHIAADRPALVRAAADHLARALASVVAERGRCTAALAGGSTPAPVYEDLATRDLPWESVTLFTGDERCVRPDDPRSNAAMIDTHLLARLTGPRPTFLRMEAERADPESAARDYARSLPAALDLCLLGIGADGHTASLFPGSAALDESERTVVLVDDAPTPEARLTLTPPALGAARELVVVAAGADKAAAVARALEGPDDARACPAVLARAATWFLDEPAAAGLRSRV